MNHTLLGSRLVRCLALLLVISTAGCASAPRRNPIPTELIDEAEIPGFEGIRAWGDDLPRDAAAWYAQTPAQLKERYPELFGKEHDYLAISGGGANGAFAAGLLAGWSAEGSRPEFQIVTGISIGALIAPFAFLGSDYDHVLREIFTSYGTEELVTKRGTLSALNSDSLFKTDKLKELIDRYLDDEVITRIGAEAETGRFLNIGTTNLDANRPVIWRVTTIAKSGHPRAADLIRQIILASASIPAAFPPVIFDVEAGGEVYDELHVDGGASSQVFLYPASIDWAEMVEMLESPNPPRVWVIRNSRLDPRATQVRRRLVPILTRTMSSLTLTQGIGDLYRIYALAERDGLDFNLAYISEDFDARPTELFDPLWMRKLFDYAFELGQAGYPWLEAPPQFGAP